MTLIDGAQVATTREGNGHVRFDSHGRTAVLHPIWLRDRSCEPGQVEPTNRQRLFTPRDIPLDLTVTACSVEGSALVVSFSDGHLARLDIVALEHALGWTTDPEEPPAPEPWSTPIEPFPYEDWSGIGWSNDDVDGQSMLSFLGSFFRYGYVVLRNTPTEVGTVERICHRLGYIVGNNFGWTFDVRVEPKPTDLAYTAIELLAHSDQPYRQPVPGIQLLHCLRNDAPGGNSTLVDGLAGAQALAAHDPAAHAAVVTTMLEWRYDMGSDTVVNRGHLLSYDRSGRFQQVRLNTKLEAPIAGDGADLDAFYRGRRWLVDWFNDAAHQVMFRLEPGDVMFMDNHRVLHGRTAFDPSKGVRHLQGAYIDHDGPDTMYRLAVRRQRVKTS
jgi:gamma-butyrobetaine dioxygenase